jgi:hypothetical protein
MSLGGRLETLDISAVLQTLAVGAASGRLTVTRLASHSVFVLRRGRIVYGAGGASPETLASRLLQQGLVAEKDLVVALEKQHDGQRFRRLGDVLVEMGLLAEGTLEAVVRGRLQALLGELLEWKTGFFHFDPAPEGSESPVEVDLGDFVLTAGIAPQELLMRALAARDRGDRTIPPVAAEPSPGGPPRGGAPSAAQAPTKPAASPTGSYAADFTGEAVLSLLRFAAQLLTRAVVFSVEGPVARGVGEFGTQEPGRTTPEPIGETEISLREPSILRLAVERRRTYTGPLEPTRANLLLLASLGGGDVREAVALPLVVRGEVRFVLYGDNAPSGRMIGPLDALEAAAARAARIVEKTLDARERDDATTVP